MLRSVVAVSGIVMMLIWAAPWADADPAGGAVVDAPTLSWSDLGADTSLSFYGDTSSATLSFPVPAGLSPVALNATLDLPFNLRSGILTVTQDDRLISKQGLPLTDLAPLVIPLPDVRVVDQSVTLTLTLAALPDDGYCLDRLNPVNLINGSVAFTGAEVAPTTVADFLPPILRKLTIAVPPSPSQAESDAAVQLATALVSRYRTQAPQVVMLPLTDGATTVDTPSVPLERQIVIKEGPDEGLSLVGTGGVPQLFISGPANKLKNEARLLSDGSLDMAVSTKVVTGQLRPDHRFPGNSATLAELGQPALTSVGVAPQVGIGLDQTKFGHPTQGFQVHVVGSYTPVPSALGGQVTLRVGDETLESWPAEPSGVIDRWVDIPDRLVQRYTSLLVAVNTAGNTGRCGEFQPITLTVNGGTVVQSTPAMPPIPPGFRSLPQALMPQVQVGIGQNSFADTVRATQITTGLQRITPVALSTEVTSVEQALDSDNPAILISADGWTDKSITIPVSANDRSITLQGFAPGDPPTTLTLDPGVRFGSLQTVFEGRRSLLIATSNGAPAQLDDLLRWLNTDPRRWSDLRGNAIVAVAGREPASVTGREPVTVYGPPMSVAEQQTTAGRYRYTPAWWAAAGVVVAAALGVAAIAVTARRDSSGNGRSHPRD